MANNRSAMRTIHSAFHSHITRNTKAHPLFGILALVESLLGQRFALGLSKEVRIFAGIVGVGWSSERIQVPLGSRFSEEWLWLLSWSLRSVYFIRALVAKRKREDAMAEFTEREVGASRRMCQKAIMSMPN